MCEQIDEMIGSLIGDLLKSRLNDNVCDDDNDLVIAVTGDHSTPVQQKDHSADPVPFLVTKLSLIRNAMDFTSSATGPLTDSVQQFGESYCASGALGRFLGLQMLDFVKSFACSV